MTEWTTERVDTLRRMHAEGASFGQIGAEVGCSRNAAIGKAHRIGLWRPFGHAKPMKPRKPRKPRALVNISARAERADFVEFELPPERIEDQAIPVDQRRQLLDLGNEHCRWPVGDPGCEGFFFCGAPDADCDGGKPYCRSHAALAFTGRPQRGTPFIPRRCAA